MAGAGAGIMDKVEPEPTINNFGSVTRIIRSGSNHNQLSVGPVLDP